MDGSKLVVAIPLAAYEGFHQWFEGTGIMQGTDEDALSAALKDAWGNAAAVKVGGGHQVRVVASRRVLDLLVEYTGYCETANSDEKVHDELRGARIVRQRVRRVLEGHRAGRSSGK